MIKTTLKEIKRSASVEGRNEFKKWLDENNVRPIKVEIVAYSVSTYGLGSYLARFELDNGNSIKVATGNRSSWLYSIRNSDFGL